MSDNMSISREEDHTEEIQSEPSERIGTKIRQYFRRYFVGSRTYNQCLIKGCDSRIAGEQTCNLKRHLRQMHNINLTLESTDNLAEVCQPALNVDIVETNTFHNPTTVTPNPRKYFRTLRVDGKIVTKCLIRGCKQRIAGKLKFNLWRHLRQIHKLDPSKCTGSAIDGNHAQSAQKDTFQRQRNKVESNDVNKYFESVIENGTLYSICLIKNCCRRFSGKNIETLKIHLQVAHDMNLSSASTEDSSDNDEKYGSVEENEEMIEDVDANATNWADDICANEDTKTSRKAIGNEESDEDWRKYFRRFRQNGNGKIYSKCLMDGCQRNMTGQSKSNLVRHLRIVHKMLIYYPRRANIPEAYSSTADVPLNTVVNTKKIPYYFPAGVNYRKYFKIVTERDRLYSKCLIKGCDRRLAGKCSGNLVRHLRLMHGAKPQSKANDCPSGDDESADENLLKTDGELNEESNESIQLRKDSPKGEFASTSYRSEDIEMADNEVKCAANEDVVNDKFAAISEAIKSKYFPRRKYFRTVRKNGKTHSKCLIEGCGRSLAGRIRGNMLRHLLLIHQIVMPTNDLTRERDPVKVTEESIVRKHFELVIQDNKTFSKCLIEGCDRLLTGRITGNMKRHLRLVHRIDSLSTWLDDSDRDYDSAENASDDDHDVESENDPAIVSENELISADAESTENKPEIRMNDNNESAIRGNQIASYLKNYFAIVTENQKIFSKCLIDGCDRRLAGNVRGNQVRHLRLMHLGHSMNNVTDAPSGASEYLKMEANVEERKKSSEKLTHDASISVDVLPRNEDHKEFVAHLDASGFRDDLQEFNSAIESNWQDYFEIITENGKTFSKCLIEGCERLLTGKIKCNQIRHLRLVHAKNSLAKSSDGSSGTVDSTDNSRMNAEAHRNQDNSTSCDAVTVHHVQTKFAVNEDTFENNDDSESHENLAILSNWRDYFEISWEEGKYYSKCLLEGCDRRLAGHMKCNLVRHLRLMHLKISSTKSTKCVRGNEESIVCAEQPKESARVKNRTHEPSNIDMENSMKSTDADENDNNSKLSACRKYFRTYRKNGKYFSRCLVRGCGRHLAGKVTCNLKRHLRLIHQVNTFDPESENLIDENVSVHESESEESEADVHEDSEEEDTASRPAKAQLAKYRQYFATVTENGRTFSKCLFFGCERQLAGEIKGNMLRHLRLVHRTQLGQSLRPGLQTCRLCFEKTENAIDIFADELNVANVLRLHFTSTEVKLTQNFSLSILFYSFFYFPFQVSENDLLPKYVCSACWSNLENFHKFYLAANRAKDNYLAHVMKNDTAQVLESACKDEPPDMVEYVTADSNWQQEDSALDELLLEATIDNRDFDAVFCEEFIPDRDAMADDAGDRIPAQRQLQYSVCKDNLRRATRKNTLAGSLDGFIPRKRSAGDSGQEFICRFCDETFSSTNEINMHYEIEHSSRSRTSCFQKRVKR